MTERVYTIADFIIENANLRRELAAMTAERDEWQRRARVAQDAQISRGDVFSDTNPEAQYIKDCENACPACGGSGHKDDAASYVTCIALVAAAYKAAARLVTAWSHPADIAAKIHDLTPADSVAALDHMLAQAEAKGRREVWAEAGGDHLRTDKGSPRSIWRASRNDRAKGRRVYPRSFRTISHPSRSTEGGGEVKRFLKWLFSSPACHCWDDGHDPFSNDGLCHMCRRIPVKREEPRHD